MDIAQFVQRLQEVSARFPGVPMYIFGSRAKGQGRRDSDLDIAVFNAKGSEFAEIEECLQDTNLPYTMDILCMELIENDALKREVLKNGIKI